MQKHANIYKGGEANLNDEEIEDLANYLLSQKPNIKYNIYINKGSMRGAMFNLMASMIGVGFLTLPTIGINNGLFAIVAFIFVAQGTSLIGNVLLMHPKRACGKPTYCGLVEWALGTVIFIYCYIFMLKTKLGMVYCSDYLYFIVYDCFIY